MRTVYFRPNPPSPPQAIASLSFFSSTARERYRGRTRVEKHVWEVGRWESGELVAWMRKARLMRPVAGIRSLPVFEAKDVSVGL